MDDEKFQGEFFNISLPDKISERILDLIRSRELKPGDKLPPERDLADIMNVGRSSIRESIRSLAAMNVLEMRQGSGTYVSSLEPELLVEKLELVFSVNDSTFLDVIQARKTLEPQLALLAAQRINETQLQTIAKIMDQTRKCVATTPLDFPTHDVAFHVAIAEAAGNATLLNFVRAITRLSLASSRRTATDIDAIRAAFEQHEVVYKAIREREPEQARDFMTYHLIDVEAKMVSLLHRDED